MGGRLFAQATHSLPAKGVFRRLVEQNVPPEFGQAMSSKRLLIVDDEPDFGQFVCMVAEEMDFEVKVTTRATVFKEAY